MPDRSRYNLRNLLVGSLSLIVGLVLVIIAEKIDRSINPLVRGLLETSAISLLVGGFLGLGYEFLLRKELLREFDDAIAGLTAGIRDIRLEIDHRMTLASAVDILGLAEIGERESHFDYTEMITKSKCLYFAFNDGRTWFSNHEHDISRRAEIAGFETHIILVNPDSPFINALGEKVSQTPEELRRKIDETTRMMSRLSWSHNLNVYGHNMPTSYSLVMNDDKAVFIPYPMARKTDKIPCFVFSSKSDDGFYAALRRDVHELINLSGTTRLFPRSLV
jgi:hypothetical protein